MITTQEIMNDIVLLPSLSVNDPRYNFYAHRIMSKIRIGYDSNYFSKDDADDLLFYFRKSSANDLSSTRETIKVFRDFIYDGGNILTKIDMKNIVNCRELCETLITLRDKGVLGRVSSDAVCVKCLERVYSKFETLIAGEHDRNLYDTMVLLEKILYKCLFVPSTTNRVHDIKHTYFNFKKDLLEKDKEFYYQPSEDSGSMKNSTKFSKSSSENLNSMAYSNYHLTKFTIDLMTEYYDNPMNVSFIRSRIIREISESGLIPELIEFLTISVSSYLANYCICYAEDVIVNMSEVSLDRICYFNSTCLAEALKLAVEFVEYTSKEKLIRFTVGCADILSKNEKAIKSGYIAFNSSLDFNLGILEGANIIGVKERESIYFRESRRVEQ